VLSIEGSTKGTTNWVIFYAMCRFDLFQNYSSNSESENKKPQNRIKQFAP